MPHSVPLRISLTSFFTWRSASSRPRNTSVRSGPRSTRTSFARLITPLVTRHPAMLRAAREPVLIWNSCATCASPCTRSSCTGGRSAATCCVTYSMIR